MVIEHSRHNQHHTAKHTWVWSALLLCATLKMSVVAQAQSWQMEAFTATINTATATDWNSYTFNHSYSSPPLVFALAANAGGFSGNEPMTVRVRHVTTTGFEATMVEPAGVDGPHASNDVDFLVVEAGVHTLPDGTTVEAGQLRLRDVQAASAAYPELQTSWASIDFRVTDGLSQDSVVDSLQRTATPVFLTQIQSAANEIAATPAEPANPWLTVAVRNLGPSGVELALERSEVVEAPPPATDAGVSMEEHVAYLVWDAAAASSVTDNTDNVLFWQSVLLENVTGFDDQSERAQSNFEDFTVQPVVLAGLNSRNSDDGGWLRVDVRTQTQVSVFVDEDLSLDNERSRAGESASVLALSPGIYAFDLDSDGDGLDDGLERKLGTDPSAADSDGDGLTDAQELEFGTDPSAADSDGDGLCDGVTEVAGQCAAGEDAASGRNSDGDAFIDALDPDDDGDGVLTAEELGGDSDGDGVPDYLDPDPVAVPAPGTTTPTIPAAAVGSTLSGGGCSATSLSAAGLGTVSWLALALLWLRRRQVQC